MSAITTSLLSRLSGLSLSPSRHDSTDTDSVISAQGMYSTHEITRYVKLTTRLDTYSSSVASSSSSSTKPFDARSCHSDSAVDTSSSRDTTFRFQPKGLRRNEHLAVLLPKNLWKVSYLFVTFSPGSARHCPLPFITEARDTSFRATLGSSSA